MDRPSGHLVIEATNLSRDFTVGRRSRRRTIEAVKEVSFSVEPGERLAFIGPNGAGKSTSIKMLTGILYPTAGTASVLGFVPWDNRVDLARKIGTVFGQRSQLWHELPPRASFRMLATFFGMTDVECDRRVAELGEHLEATELFDQPVRTLSLGQRMRCELSASLLHSPRILFLDEPSIGLDLVAKQHFRQLLVELNQEQGCTIFLTSHDVADIEHVADRVIIVNHGTIIYDDSVAAMRRNLLRTKRVEITFASPFDDGHLVESLDAGSDGSAVALAGSTAATAKLEVDTERRPIREILDVLLRQGPVVDLTVLDPPLEHVIGEIYQRPRDGVG